MSRRTIQCSGSSTTSLMPALPRRPFYRNRRPTKLGRWLNRAWAAVYALGVLPSFLVALETKGRRTGRWTRNAVVVADYEGDRYLVSMLGERVDWVRNIRAASNTAVLHRRGRHPVRLEDVPIEQRAPILAVYYRRATGARPHFDVPERPALEEFARIAPDHPVFRIIDAP